MAIRQPAKAYQSAADKQPVDRQKLPKSCHFLPGIRHSAPCGSHPTITLFKRLSNLKPTVFTVINGRTRFLLDPAPDARDSRRHNRLGAKCDG